ncbi:MAG: hydroxymethylglutaryl-CoA lyase [Flavobacteriales bacterium]|nr:hydroxymethylglutaryl-CoA lyase [Flavobacteriales bacterium]
MVRLTECPRDAMQGIGTWIPTEDKIRYINSLLKVGFDVMDFGSFVSEKAVPQMRDTEEVLNGLTTETSTLLLAIVANERGALKACEFERIRYIGYPFSVSETFQRRNTNAGIAESVERLHSIMKAAGNAGKEVVVYLSMGFGNPYGDPWSPELVTEWCKRLYEETGARSMALSDTVGVSDPENITALFSVLIPSLKDVSFGAHLHTTPSRWREKIVSAYEAGCRSFDGALGGFGGCPMAADDLTGNMPTENLISYLKEKGEAERINTDHLRTSMHIMHEVFPNGEG